MGDAVMLEANGLGLGDGIVGADNFNGAGIARAFFIDHDNAVRGLFLGAKPRHANHQHMESILAGWPPARSATARFDAYRRLNDDPPIFVEKLDA